VKKQAPEGKMSRWRADTEKRCMADRRPQSCHALFTQFMSSAYAMPLLCYFSFFSGPGSTDKSIDEEIPCYASRAPCCASSGCRLSVHAYGSPQMPCCRRF